MSRILGKLHHLQCEQQQHTALEVPQNPTSVMPSVVMPLWGNLPYYQLGCHPMLVLLPALLLAPVHTQHPTASNRQRTASVCTKFGQSSPCKVMHEAQQLAGHAPVRRRLTKLAVPLLPESSCSSVGDTYTRSLLSDPALSFTCSTAFNAI